MVNRKVETFVSWIGEEVSKPSKKLFLLQIRTSSMVAPTRYDSSLGGRSSHVVLLFGVAKCLLEARHG